jgi:voltage-gated potassium channel Kch
LRDFFLIIFFIILGFNTDFSNIKLILIPAIALSLIVLIIKPIILMFLSTLFGYTKRTNFLVGTSLAQISEFSLIVLFLGVSLGHVGNEVLQTIILTMIITILLSTYMVIYSQKFYDKMKWFADLFEKKRVNGKDKMINNKYDAILFGYNRIGFSILNSLKNSKRKYLVVDFNPDTILTLNKFKIPCLYGDVDDVDFLKELPLDKVELVISTVPECETNSVLINAIRKVNKNAIIIVRAHLINDALELYKKGADYVLTPHFLGGEYVSNMIHELKNDSKGYEKEREKHIKMLKDAAIRGEEHPHVDKG